MKLGKRISLYRKQLGWTQGELAKKCGTTQSHLSKIEREEINPSSKTIMKIASLFNVSIDELMGENDRKPTHEMTEATEIARLVFALEQESPGLTDALRRLLASPLLKSEDGLEMINKMMDMFGRK